MEEEFPIYTVFLSFHARDEEDAEDFVLSMSGSDWLEHLELDETEEE